MIKRLVILLLIVTCNCHYGYTQETRVNKRKIEREHRRKERKAEKNYQKAKKEHFKIQSKETQTMMKKSSKQSKRKTPMKPPGGKKCK